jgi:glucokinase
MKETEYSQVSRRESILVADVGGTNTTFALFQDRMVLKLHFESKSINHFSAAVKEVLLHLKKEHNISPSKAVFAVAGPVAKDGFSKITNLPWNISTKDIFKKTGLKSTLINDFEAIGYGIEGLPKKDIIKIKKGQIQKGKPKIVLGAGTDLGKVMLIWNEKSKQYQTLPSEGGHDLASFLPEELPLVQFIRSHGGIGEWGDLLSGRGISWIYRSLSGRTKYSAEIEKNKYSSDLITKYRKKDLKCKKTFNIFMKFYARCTQNFALDILPFGGIYIAGGIAAKNNDIFGRTFVKEFVTNRTQSELLKQMPIFLITNYDVSLYGAAVYCNKRLNNEDIR